MEPTTQWAGQVHLPARSREPDMEPMWRAQNPAAGQLTFPSTDVNRPRGGSRAAGTSPIGSPDRHRSSRTVLQFIAKVLQLAGNHRPEPKTRRSYRRHIVKKKLRYSKPKIIKVTLSHLIS